MYHFGAAGSRFSSLEVAAEQHLIDNCKGFPQTGESFVQPEIFINKFTEEIDSVSGEPRRHPQASPGAHKVIKYA